MLRLQTLDVVPTIVSLQDHLETIRQAEIDRVRGRLGSMTTDQEMAVEALTRGIVNKIMHTPISTLKTAARDPESTTVIDLVRRLFNLHSEDRTRTKQDAASDKTRTWSRRCSDTSAEEGRETDGSPAHRLSRLTTRSLAGPSHFRFAARVRATPSNWRSSRPLAIKSPTLPSRKSAPRACLRKRSKKR